MAYYAVLDLQQPPPGADDGLGPEQRRDFSAVLGLGDDARTAQIIRHTLAFLRDHLAP